MKLKHFWVNLVPISIRAKDRDEAADLAKEKCGEAEIDEIEEDDYDMDDDS